MPSTKKGNRGKCEVKVGKVKPKTKKKQSNPPTPCSYSSEAGAFQGSFTKNYTMFSFPLTDYISTLESIPFNYKQLLHLTKVSLTVAAVRGPGLDRSA